MYPYQVVYAVPQQHDPNLLARVRELERENYLLRYKLNQKETLEPSTLCQSRQLSCCNVSQSSAFTGNLFGDSKINWAKRVFGDYSDLMQGRIKIYFSDQELTDELKRDILKYFLENLSLYGAKIKVVPKLEIQNLLQGLDLNQKNLNEAAEQELLKIANKYQEDYEKKVKVRLEQAAKVLDHASEQTQFMKKFDDEFYHGEKKVTITPDEIPIQGPEKTITIGDTGNFIKILQSFEKNDQWTYDTVDVKDPVRKRKMIFWGHEHALPAPLPKKKDVYDGSLPEYDVTEMSFFITKSGNGMLTLSIQNGRKILKEQFPVSREHFDAILNELQK